MFVTITPEIEKALAAESKAELLARDSAMSTWIAMPGWREFARGRVERGLAPAPRAASKPAPAKPAKPAAPKLSKEAELARRLAACEAILGEGALDRLEAADEIGGELDRVFGLDAAASEAGVRFDARTGVQSFGAPARVATKAAVQHDRERLDAAFSDHEPGTAVVDDGVIQSFGVKRGAK